MCALDSSNPSVSPSKHPLCFAAMASVGDIITELADVDELLSMRASVHIGIKMNFGQSLAAKITSLTD